MKKIQGSRKLWKTLKISLTFCGRNLFQS